MLRFALSRIAMAIPTLLIVAVAVFVLIRLIPGDPAQLLLGDLATPASLADLRARLGLDQSWLVQFGIWFNNMLHGDLGESINTGQSVAGLVWERFLVSARVVLVAVLFATRVAVPAGMVGHAFRNAFGPTWTLIGLVLGNLLGGIAVVETVFTIPGLGRLLVDAIFARDYPVIQGCLLFVAVTYVIVNLIVDLCYPLFDPRVTAE